ncbi:Ykof family thiamine-binding protein [Leucobacter allii]|uniref:Ykof family thiamine-binding protein n=1 Tax=Leucobacter allii TaxID=2932247 RepID=A0ABY4FPT7_9MICO|nr:Ykof family thiamine-binding protein [Leucobacter allii]UOQ58294.1 Ykof family thiamine-binding protein [Leucobacter allii]
MTSSMTPQQYGVGARFTLSVYDSDYVRIILDALAAADAAGLVVETNDISTFVSGAEQRVLEYLAAVIGAAAASGAHLSAAILLSRGCPGELQCALPPGVPALGAAPVSLAGTGVRARAHWSLYPLLDAGPAEPAVPAERTEPAAPETTAPAASADGSPEQAPDRHLEHMAPIYAAIEAAKRDGIYAGSDHYATRLDGDLAAVLETVANAWIGVGASVQHVVTHLTVSVNSPTPVSD